MFVSSFYVGEMSSYVASFATNPKFVEGFAKSASMIVLSEIGDKTFFIAVIMAMKHSRTIVFLGSWLALFAMTALSAMVGAAAPKLISPRATRACATALFFVFGARSIAEAIAGGGDGDGDDEMGEAEAELTGRARGKNGMKKKKGKTKLSDYSVFSEAFVVTFLAEWGDRSQIATIGLAAASDVLGVTLGGALGHAACTGIAVVGGRHMASRVNERAVSLCGGVLFVLFGLHSLISGTA